MQHDFRKQTKQLFFEYLYLNIKHRKTKNVKDYFEENIFKTVDFSTTEIRKMNISQDQSFLYNEQCI